MVMRDLPPALLEALHTQLVSTNIPNDDISQWIKVGDWSKHGADTQKPISVRLNYNNEYFLFCS